MGATRRPRQREIPRPGALVRSVSFSFRTCPRIDADAGGGFPPRAAGKPRFRVARGRLVSVISSVASFQCPLPATEGRDCKGNNFSPSPQAPKDLFSRAGTAVPRLRLQRYCRFAPQSKFFPNFFTKNFTPLNQHPANQQLPKPTKTTKNQPHSTSKPHPPLNAYFLITIFNTDFIFRHQMIFSPNTTN